MEDEASRIRSLGLAPEAEQWLLSGKIDSVPDVIEVLEKFCDEDISVRLNYWGDDVVEFAGATKDGSDTSNIPDDWFPKNISGYRTSPWFAKNIASFDDDAIVEVVEILSAHAVLKEALEAEGLELREDSRLCQAYVMYDEGEVADIVATMREMRFFHEHTRYAEYARALRRDRERTSMAASEIAKRAAMHGFDGAQDQVPPKFRGLKPDDTAAALDIAEEAVRAEQDYHDHACWRCGAWKDDDDYCSMCGTDDSESDSDSAWDFDLRTLQVMYPK